MDTSPAMRLAMIGLLFVACWVIGYANIRNVVRLILKRKASRPALVVWGALGLLVVFCIVDTFKIEPDWVRVSYNTLETTKLAPGARVRIVQLSDLHLERIGRREKRTLHLTALQQPDIIVLTGDYLNQSNPALLEDFGRRLVQIAPTYAICGNWDGDKQMEWLSRSGVKQVSQWTVVKCGHGAKIALGCLPWTQSGVNLRKPEGLGALYKVLLCHIPQVLETIPEDRTAWIDLMLAGHTHGGQVRIPIFGALIPDRMLVGKYQWGLYDFGKSKLYVSSGIGMEGGAPEVRFCCRPEVVVLDVVGKR